MQIAAERLARTIARAGDPPQTRCDGYTAAKMIAKELRLAISQQSYTERVNERKANCGGTI